MFPSCPDQTRERYSEERERTGVRERELELEEKNQRKGESVLLPKQNEKEKEERKKERKKEREGRTMVAESPKMGVGCVSGDVAVDRPSVGVGRPTLL